MTSKCMSTTASRIITPKTTVNLLTFAPFEIVAMDIFGPIQYHQKEQYVLVMIDHFTRYVILSSVTRTVTSQDIWRLLLEKWISIFGTPRILLTDNASIFTSTFLLTKLQDMQIRKANTTPYYPAGNSIAENFNRTLAAI